MTVQCADDFAGNGSGIFSEEAMELDAPVLECEFDPDTFCRPEK